MGKLLLVARRELGAFFTTWMGYIIITAALIIDGLLFNSFAIGDSPKYSAEVLYDFFYFASGVSVIAGLFLAMRLFAEEKQTGTIILYYTSPISERQIVYGKFLSAVCFLLLMHVISLYMPGLIFVHGKVSLGHLASGYLCLMAIGSAAIAISLFASCVSPNQLTAGVLGGAMIVLFLVLWMVANVVEPPLKAVFSHMALHNIHFSSMAKGIVHSRDIIYYFSLTLFFLECSVRALEIKRWRG